jgi:hypothetical protein
MEEEVVPPAQKKKKDVVSAKRLDRAMKVFELRKGGGSFRAISDALKKQAEDKGESTRGYSHEQVRADFELAVRIKTDNLGDAVVEAQILTAERLDDIYLKISPLLNGTKPSTKIKAAAVLIRANKEYAELHGAKKPLKIEHSGKVDSDVVHKLGDLSTDELLKLKEINEKLNAS